MPIKILLEILFLLLCNVCLADTSKPWQVKFKEPITEAMRDSIWREYFVIGLVSFLVLLIVSLSIYALYRHNSKTNPIPEYIEEEEGGTWKIILLGVVLAVIATPMVKILYREECIPKCEFTIKITGNQWYWTYQYLDHKHLDHNNLSFDSHRIADDKLKENQIRLFSVDNNLVLPVDTRIKIVVTSNDVIHRWGVPAFKKQLDAIPGDVNETWINVIKTGIYYGKCLELCGAEDGFMPIVVEVVSKEEFDEWLKKSRTKFSSNFSSNY